MFRIDDATAVAALPTPEAVGTPGYFTEGSPGVQVPTNVRASFMNMLQEEFISVLTAAGITPSKTTYNQLLAAIKKVTDGRLIGVQIFIANGTYTPAVGMASAIIEAVGGGAGGGGTTATGAAQYSVSAGGASGAYGKGRYTAAQIGASQAVTIGNGGAGGAVGGGTGGAGGTTSLGALLSCPGGNGGSGQGATPTGSFSVMGGQPTKATGGNIFNSTGNPGGLGVVGGTSGEGGGSGIANGTGGGSPQASIGVGQAGQVAGAGGSGAVTTTSDAGRIGGAGASGMIIVWEFA